MTPKETNKLFAEFLGYEFIGWNDPRHAMPQYKGGYWGIKGQQPHLKLEGTFKSRHTNFLDEHHILMVARKIVYDSGFVSIHDIPEDEWESLFKVMDCSITVPIEKMIQVCADYILHKKNA